MLNVLIAIGVFATILLFIQAAQNIYTTVLGPEHQRFRRRLRRAAEQQSESSLLLVKTLHITFPWFDKLIARMPPGLQRLPAQANVRVSLEKLFSLSLLCGFVGLIGSLVVNAGSLTILCAMLLGFLFPFLYVFHKRRKRFLKFEQQFPNAMDLVARSLRAGHPFLGSLKLVSEEMDDPVGTEFRKTVEEITFGIETEQALKNLVQRIDSVDLKFFVTAAVIQRETGGNLAEIVEAISEVIRQRFDMQSRTQSLTAEGRLSAVVLFAMPIVLLLALSVLNPTYTRVLFVDPAGQGLLKGGIVLMIIGALVMKKMVAIKI
ncbi:MAG: type II secretion system F family protein [Nitrospirae bacterium]|nr:MAG: type II secretion system F family protein [Nitrospirota bacterium]